jgi:hypothetical protein
MHHGDILVISWHPIYWQHSSSHLWLRTGVDLFHLLCRYRSGSLNGLCFLVREIEMRIQTFLTIMVQCASVVCAIQHFDSTQDTHLCAQALHFQDLSCAHTIPCLYPLLFTCMHISFYSLYLMACESTPPMSHYGPYLHMLHTHLETLCYLLSSVPWESAVINTLG